MAKSKDKRSPILVGFVLSLLLHCTLIVIILFRGFNSPASVKKPSVISGRIVTLDNFKTPGSRRESSPKVPSKKKPVKPESRVNKPEPRSAPEPKKPEKVTKPVTKTEVTKKAEPEEKKVIKDTSKEKVVDISTNKKPVKEVKKEPEKVSTKSPEPPRSVSKKEDFEKKRKEFLDKLQNRKTKEDILADLKKSTESKQVARANTDSYDITSPEGDGNYSSANNAAISLYADAVQQEIANNWNIPPSLPTDGSLVAKVFFRSNENGDIFDLRIKESSGNKSFDEFCLRAIIKASPLKTIPPPEILRQAETQGIEASFRNSP